MSKSFFQQLNTYEFLNYWSLDRPVETTWKFITDETMWYSWLGDIVTIDSFAPDQSLGKGQVYKTCWRGPLPYSLKLDVEIINIVPYSAVSVQTEGDLIGNGVVEFKPDNAGTVITFTWQAQPTRLWMKMLAPFAKRLFEYSHNKLLNEGFRSFNGFLIKAEK